MVMRADDIQKGMDVFGIDGDKVGTVAEIYGGAAGTTDTSDMTGSGGGRGALGDESRLQTAYGHGGPGTLGDESRVDTGYGRGGHGVLGDESGLGPAANMGDTDTTSTDVSGTTGSQTPSAFQGSDTPDFEETDVLVVEEVPSGTTGGYDATDTGPGGTAGTPGGFGDITAGVGSGTTQAGYTGGFGTAAGTINQTSTATGYFKVDQGGILGIGAKHLYIPFSAVENVVPGERVDLNVTKDQAGTAFANEPPGLQQNQ